MSQTDILCMGEVLFDMIAQEEKGKISGFRMNPGGAAGNVAVGISRLGGRAGIISRRSNDFFGEALLEILKENEVDTTGISVDPMRRTSLAFVRMDKEKKPNYLFYRENSACGALEKEAIHPEWFQNAKILYFTSIGLIREPLRSANYYAVSCCEKSEVRVAFDPNIRLNLWPSRQHCQESVLEMLGHAQIVKMNDEELCFLTGEQKVETCAERLLEKFPQIELLAITLGSRGAYLKTKDGKAITVRPFDTEVVDTVGAGDAFCAGLLVKYLEKGLHIRDLDELEEIGRFSNAAALLTAKGEGAIPALPDRAAVEQLCGRYQKKGVTK